MVHSLSSLPALSSPLSLMSLSLPPFSSDFLLSSTTRRPVFNSLVLLPNAFPLSLSPCPLRFLSYPFRSSSSKKRWRRGPRFRNVLLVFWFLSSNWQALARAVLRVQNQNVIAEFLMHALKARRQYLTSHHRMVGLPRIA